MGQHLAAVVVHYTPTFVDEAVSNEHSRLPRYVVDEVSHGWIIERKERKEVLEMLEIIG